MLPRRVTVAGGALPFGWGGRPGRKPDRGGYSRTRSVRPRAKPESAVSVPSGLDDHKQCCQPRTRVAAHVAIFRADDDAKS